MHNEGWRAILGVYGFLRRFFLQVLDSCLEWVGHEFIYLTSLK